ncbi:MAG: phosphatase PAP2 family protein [Polyangiaceae bacterium]|nr:phosphatase PAP2 family protein [Polyangiaceae bacterium]
MSQPSAPPAARALAAPTTWRVLRELGAQDWILLAYTAFAMLMTAAGSGPAYRSALLTTVGLFAFACAGVLSVRAGWLGAGRLAGIVYRVTMWNVVMLAYITMRDVLTTAAPQSYDEHLHRLDVLLVGVEPTLLLDRIVSPFLTEWASFFYFDYFLLLSAYVLPLLFVERRARVLAEFAFALMPMTCLVHTLYLLVPGYGPYKHLADLYVNPLPHGMFYDLVITTVTNAGAQKDIFPSLHTAAPTLLALMSFRHRARAPFKYVWPVTAFFAVNIIFATLYLRWHYLVDVLAGLALAITFSRLAPRVVDWEEARRRRGGLGPLWPPGVRSYVDEA